MADKNQQEKEFSIQVCHLATCLKPPRLGSNLLTLPLQPIDDTNKDQGKGGFIEAIKSKVAPHTAAPGPAQSHDHSQIPQEGTKEERLAKAQELNK